MMTRGDNYRVKPVLSANEFNHAEDFIFMSLHLSDNKILSLLLKMLDHFYVTMSVPLQRSVSLPCELLMLAFTII